MDLLSPSSSFPALGLDLVVRERVPQQRPSLASAPWLGLLDPRPAPAPTSPPRRPLAERPRAQPASVPAPSLPRATSAAPAAAPFERAGTADLLPGRQDLRVPGSAAHVGAGLRAGAVVQPGRPGHFSGLHEAMGDLRSAAAASPAHAACGFEHGASHVRAAALARSGLGWIDLAARCSAPGDALLPAAVAGAGWMDRLTAHASGLEGAAGEISVALRLDATLRAGVNGSAAARLMLGVWVDGVGVPLLPAPCWGGRPRLGEAPLDQALGCLVVARLPVVFGQPFDLSVFALARAGCEPALPPPPVLPSSAVAEAGIGSGRPGSAGRAGQDHAELRWAGVRSVHAASRSKALMHFKQYRLESATGRDWRAPFAAVEAR
jgi:hypothetical protein